MELKVIAYARNGHTDKFGIPRQSREDSPILTRIVFEPEYNVPEALRGIEGYSHLWIIWGFSAARPASPERPGTEPGDCKTANAVRPQAEPAVGQSWSPTVRPPRLGGNKRMGVFATRSPFRPNPIGLSSVRLIAVRLNDKLRITNDERQITNDELRITRDGRMELIVSGADVLDGTPIYDIKPYLSFSDSHPDAKNGFAEETKDYHLEVRFEEFLIGNNQYEISTKPVHNTDKVEIFPKEVLEDITYILRQDPRPAYQDDPEREYKMDYAGFTITFVVKDTTVIVKKIEKI